MNRYTSFRLTEELVAHAINEKEYFILLQARILAMILLLMKALIQKKLQTGYFAAMSD